MNKFNKLALSVSLLIAAGIAGCTSSSSTTDTTTTDTTHTTTTVHWSYDDTGTTGPSNWHTLDAAYSACEAGTVQSNDFTGDHQSPVDFVAAANTAVSLNLTGANGALAFERTNNGHTIQLTESDANNSITITLNGVIYTLLQFHFHSQSEHTEASGFHPMEGHFVFSNTDDPANTKYAVVGVFIDVDDVAPNTQLEAALVAPLPTEGVTDATLIDVIVDQIITDGSDAYQYNGSFTTPPCTNGVAWTVIKTPVKVPQAIVDEFQVEFPNPPGNNRPTTGQL